MPHLGHRALDSAMLPILLNGSHLLFGARLRCSEVGVTYRRQCTIKAFNTASEVC